MNWKTNPFIFLLIAVSGIVVSGTLIGCNKQAEPNLKGESPVVAITTLTSRQQEQKKLAITAKEKLFTSLVGELTKSMNENGPAQSITVCRTSAPAIAESVGKETGVRIGRTSFKLRNADNGSPAWAAEFVADRVNTETVVELPENGLGILLPIRLQATCTLCHGNDDQVMPEVKAAIVSNYPDDNAMGFTEGELRGYFWIEVPSEESAN